MYALLKYSLVILPTTSSTLCIDTSAGSSRTSTRLYLCSPTTQPYLVIDRPIPSRLAHMFSSISFTHCPTTFQSRTDSVDLPEQLAALWKTKRQGSLPRCRAGTISLILTRNLSALSWKKRFWKMSCEVGGLCLQKVTNCMLFSWQKLTLNGCSSPDKQASNSYTPPASSSSPRRSVPVLILLTLLTARLPLYSELSSYPILLELYRVPTLMPGVAFVGISVILWNFLRFCSLKRQGYPVEKRQLARKWVS